MLHNKGLKCKTQQFCKYRGGWPLKFSAQQPLVNVFQMLYFHRQKQNHIYNIAYHSQCYGLWQTHFFVCLPLCFHKMNKDRVTFNFSCLVKCTISTKLTCNHSANKLAVVANIVLCVHGTSLRPLSLWPCTWTLTVFFFLQANQADVWDSLSS